MYPEAYSTPPHTKTSTSSHGIGISAFASESQPIQKTADRSILWIQFQTFDPVIGREGEKA